MQAAAECGLIAVRLRSQALQPNQLERSSVCGHCNKDGACIECPQCQSEVYCSKACLRKARKQHRKSCVNAANAHTRKLQFCCNKGDIDELNFQRICQRSVNVKEEWYQVIQTVSSTINHSYQSMVSGGHSHELYPVVLQVFRCLLV